MLHTILKLRSTLIITHSHLCNELRTGGVYSCQHHSDWTCQLLLSQCKNIWSWGEGFPENDGSAFWEQNGPLCPCQWQEFRPLSCSDAHQHSGPVTTEIGMLVRLHDYTQDIKNNSPHGLETFSGLYFQSSSATQPKLRSHQSPRGRRRNIYPCLHLRERVHV